MNREPHKEERWLRIEVEALLSPSSRSLNCVWYWVLLLISVVVEIILLVISIVIETVLLAICIVSLINISLVTVVAMVLRNGSYEVM